MRPAWLTRRVRVLAAFAGLAACVAIGTRIVPSSDDAVRLRNALLASVQSDPAWFAWSPGAEPAGFLSEHAVPPDSFAARARRITAGATGDVARALALAAHLVTRRQNGQRLLLDTEDAYRRIVARGDGYCSDFTQVYSGLALAAGIPVREWGMAFTGFGGGHAFNEIWDAEHRRWVLIDSFNALWFADAASGTPLGWQELRGRLLEPGAPAFEVREISPGRLGFRTKAAAETYFRAGADQTFLWMGNNVFSYDAHPVVRRLAPVSRSVEQLGAIAAGVHPHIVLYGSATNRVEAARLMRLRSRFLTLAAVAMALGLWVAAELGGAVGDAWRARRGARRGAPQQRGERSTKV